MSGRDTSLPSQARAGAPWRFLRDELAYVLLTPVLAGCALIAVAGLSIGIHTLVLREPEPTVAAAAAEPMVPLWDCTPIPGSDTAPFDCAMALTGP